MKLRTCAVLVAAALTVGTVGGGVRSVAVTSIGRLQVHYNGHVRTMGLSAGVDETLAGPGIQIGVDGTSSYATMTL